MNSRRVRDTLLPASAALLMLGVSFPARAVLERVGPTDPTLSGGGFPAWYQDTSGLALEFCSPSNVSEVAGGWCLLLPADVPVIPESFPGNFFDEHFYFAGDATLSPVSGGKALLRVSEEAAFAGAGVPFAGQQITFSRIRVKLTGIPVTGIYRFIHPYGEESIFATAGSPRGIFFTDDVGINCPPGGPFDCALQSRLGPFLLPSAVAGGAEMAALTAANPTPDTDPAHFGGVFAATPYPGTGKSYIADPARIGPVTGSPLGTFIDSTGVARDHNIFRIEGPAGSNLGGPGIDFIETTNFALQGRIFASTIAGRVTVDRASYTKSATATKLDVFGSGSETIQGRLPTQARPVGVSPALSFFEAPCDTDPVTFALIAPLAVIDQQMFQDGTYFWGQSVPALIPAAVCVKDSAARDATGQIVPAFFQAKVTDEISISKAVYDPDTATLTVNATSSDTVSAPVLSVDGFGDLTLGALSYAPLMASPAKVRVRSTLGGFADLDVTTNFFGAAPGALRALNDAFTFPEDSPAQILNVLANDTSAAGGTVVVIAQPKLGTAIANPLDNTVTYTPALNANGVDAFTYQVTTAAGKSNIANVTVTITPVNDPPTAVNDGPFTVIAGRATPTALPNLLDNDIDPDGRADMVSAVQIVPAAGLIVTGGVGGVVSVSSAQPGTFSFTYKVVDKAGVVSANAATVTVVAIPGDTVTVTKAQFSIGPKRWVVTGTTSVPNQSINLTYVNGTLPGWSIGVVAVDALGNWTLDIRNVTGNDDPTTFLKRPTTLKATSSAGGSATVTITYK